MMDEAQVQACIQMWMQTLRGGGVWPHPGESGF